MYGVNPLYSLNNILEKAYAGERLTLEEGVKLLRTNDLIGLGKAAFAVRQKFHPNGVVSFVIDRNINYTNICICRCRFCAFWRNKNDRDAYVLGEKELMSKIEEIVSFGGTQLLIQGGLHPDLNLDFFLTMLRRIKKQFSVHIHSFSPPEIIHFARSAGLPVKKVLLRLKDAGLDSLPGGGAEILSDRVRKIISPAKISSKEWLEVMETAHEIGMKTTATMMFGHVETLEERVLHMIKVRELQDKTGGFTAFIPWTYQPGHTQLGGKPATAIDYLKTLAVSRLLLDNIPNIQASWVTQGLKIGQVALSFGANDLGGTMMEENVVRAAGVSNSASKKEIIRIIKGAGFTPAQRTTGYKILKTF